MSELKRTLGLWPAIATAAGIVVASSTLVTLGQGMGIAGPGFIYAIIAALILNLFVAFSFAELSGILPRAGGINHYTLPAMGPFMGMIAVISGYFLVNMFAGSAEAAIAGLVFHEVFASWMNPVVFSLILVAILIVVNILGIEFFSWLQMALTAIMIGSMIVLGIIGLTGAGGGQPLPTSFDFNHMGWGVFTLTALAFWLFVGIEFVCPLAEEIKKPRVYLPIAMIAALFIILISNLIYGFASIKYLPLDVLAGSASPHVEYASAIMGRTGQIWIGIVSITATASTLNTVLAALPRMLYGMALEGQLPKVFASLSSRKTPWVGTLFMGSLIVLFLLTGIATVENIIIFILAGAFCWIITYIIAHLDVIILRFKYPDVKRPFVSPLWLMPQILGILGLIYMMLNIFPDPEMKAQIYRYALVFIGLTAIWSAFWVKFVMKKGLFQTTSLEGLVLDEDRPTLKEDSVLATEIATTSS